MNAILAIAKNIANLVYPMRCAACGKALEASNGTGACSFCLGTVRRTPKPYCSLCGRALQTGRPLCADCGKARPAFAMARSACLYEGALKELIHLYKYKNKRSLAGLFARLMIDFLKDEAGLDGGIDAVTFVPLHKKRLRERDFNQSRMLAERIASEFALPVLDCLDKIKHTVSQNELSRETRLCNLKGAFKAHAGCRGRRLLLVDDVMTTGATLDECSRTLLDAGAVEVRCLTLARGT
jgi:ComF family protein